MKVLLHMIVSLKLGDKEREKWNNELDRSSSSLKSITDWTLGTAKEDYEQSKQYGLIAGNSMKFIIDGLIKDFSDSPLGKFLNLNGKETKKNTTELEKINKENKTGIKSFFNEVEGKNVFVQMFENIEEFLNDPKAYDDIGKQFNLTLKNSIADALKTGNFKDIGKTILDKFTSDVIDTFVNKVFEGDKKGDTINLFGALVDLVGGIFGGGEAPDPNRTNVDYSGNVHPVYSPPELPTYTGHPSEIATQSLTQNINITGDVTTQTRSIVMGMMPEIADSTQRIFNQRRILRS